jgi:hypothetical protein
MNRFSQYIIDYCSYIRNGDPNIYPNLNLGWRLMALFAILLSIFGVVLSIILIVKILT